MGKKDKKNNFLFFHYRNKKKRKNEIECTKWCKQKKIQQSIYMHIYVVYLNILASNMLIGYWLSFDFTDYISIVYIIVKHGKNLCIQFAMTKRFCW